MGAALDDTNGMIKTLIKDIAALADEVKILSKPVRHGADVCGEHLAGKPDICQNIPCWDLYLSSPAPRHPRETSAAETLPEVANVQNESKPETLPSAKCDTNCRASDAVFNASASFPNYPTFYDHFACRHFQREPYTREMLLSWRHGQFSRDAVCTGLQLQPVLRQPLEHTAYCTECNCTRTCVALPTANHEDFLCELCEGASVHFSCPNCRNIMLCQTCIALPDALLPAAFGH